MFTLVAAVSMVTMSSVWGSTNGTGSGNPPPPPQLVANLLDPLGKAAGQAGYGQQTDAKSGKITANFVNVQVGPLSKSLVGTKLTVTIDKAPPMPVTVVLDKSGNNGCVNLSLNSANKDAVPPVKPGSLVTVSPPGHPPIAQGKFAPAK